MHTSEENATSARRERIPSPLPKRRKTIETKAEGASASSAAAMATSRTVDLSETETNLRKLLVDVAHHIDSSSTAQDGENTSTTPPELSPAKMELRFTGGWVRDKLLGVQSHDIDVGINKMTGFQFGLKMKEYLDSMEDSQKREKYGLDSTKGGAKDLHKIAANPEKSKHLETVTTKILGLDIDLVNLRKETYSEDSRNPQMEFGTPEEDAMRRDATVNALFYNIHTGKVEDFTQRGLEDMENRIIRTPLEPYQTFKDDPLRVLRLIRFASRLGYSIDPAAEACMDNPDIKEALRLKISRERVGIELEKMLKGPDPRLSVSLIDRLNLYTTIFSTTENEFQPHRPWAPAYTALSNLLESDATNPAKSVLLSNQEDHYLAWLVTCFIPLADAPDEPPKKPGKPPTPLVQKVALDGIKTPTKQATLLTASLANMQAIISLKDRFLKRAKTPDRPLAENEEDPLSRDTLGMAIRTWGASWRSQVIYSMLFEVTENPDREKGM
jgi:tRNA nucleotidyltransferase (CCA-adding enzyme)